MDNILSEIKLKLMKEKIKNEIAKAMYLGEEIGYYSHTEAVKTDRSKFIKNKEKEYDELIKIDKNNKYLYYANKVIKKLEI